MRTLALLLKLSLFILTVSAKHDGQFPDDDDKTSSSTSSASSTSSQPSTRAFTVLSTSAVTTTDVDTAMISSATATSAGSTAVPSGTLQFTPPPNITMCASAIFTWAFNSSTSVPLTIVVTNERAVSNQVPSPDGTPLVERTLSTAVDARVSVVSWLHADVPAGAYTVIATDTAHTGIISAQSTRFFVNTGSDTSCLNQTSTASATASSTSGSGVSCGAGGPNDTADPTSSSRSTRSISIGAIVGTIAGILVGVGGLLLVFSLPRLRRHILRSNAPQRPGGPYMLF